MPENKDKRPQHDSVQGSFHSPLDASAQVMQVPLVITRPATEREIQDAAGKSRDETYEKVAKDMRAEAKILRRTLHTNISDEAIDAAVPLATSFSNNPLEARAIESALEKLDLGALQSMGSGLLKGRAFTTRGRNAERYDLAQESVRDLLSKIGVTYTENDVTKIVDSAVEIERTRMAKKQGQGRDNRHPREY